MLYSHKQDGLFLFVRKLGKVFAVHLQLIQQRLSPQKRKLQTTGAQGMTGIAYFYPQTRNYVDKTSSRSYRKLAKANLLVTKVISKVSGPKQTIIQHPLRAHSSQFTPLKRQT